MKKNICGILLMIIFFLSCADPGGEFIFDGFELNFSNRTNINYKGELVIGGLVNGDFIPTDSVVIDEIKMGSNNVLSTYFDEDRWKPNLSKIRGLSSDRCYFKLKLSNGREEMLVFFNSTELFNLKLFTRMYVDRGNGFTLYFLGDKTRRIQSAT